MLPSSDSTPSPLLRGLMLAALYALPLIVTLRPVADPILDPDIWWHLRVGQWVAEHRAVPSSDPFAQEHAPWVAYSWLYEVGLYALVRLGGLAGIVVYRVGMALAVVAALHALVCRFEKRFLVATGLTAVAVLAVAMLFNERPWLVTVVITTLTLHGILLVRQPEPVPRWVWLLPLLYVVWANVHIQFIYGLILLGLACVAPWLDARLGWQTPEESSCEPGSQRWWLLVGLSVACFVGTLINPYHVRLYGVVVEYATQPGPFLWVNELKALEFREPSDWALLVLTLTACFYLGRRRRISCFEILLLAGTAYLAFRARRDLWFLLLADLAILATSGPVQVSEEERYRPGWLGVAGIALVVAVVGCFRVVTQDLSAAGLEMAVARRFPVEAVKQIQARQLPGPVFNDFNWGGFLIWALPTHPVLIDGRTNLHGDARIERIGRVWAGLPGWDEDPDLLRAGVIVAPAESALVSLLRLSPGRYREIHTDALACIFIPTTRTP
ncbi:MAG: hypothetical protein U0840_26900 [Gemmataceae bacterium]